MATNLATALAGFIGITFAHYTLKKYTDNTSVKLNILTYGVNLEDKKEFEDDGYHISLREIICPHENNCGKELSYGEFSYGEHLKAVSEGRVR